MHNPYTCRLFRRIEGLVWKLRGKNVVWSKDGHLCHRYPSGSMGELPAIFPGSWYAFAARIQNKYPVTRRILSL